MRALKVERAHISGLSLGAAVGMWLAAKYPQQVKSLSLHDGWTKTDLFVKTVVEGWQVMVRGSGSVTETVIQAFSLGVSPPNSMSPGQITSSRWRLLSGGAPRSPWTPLCDRRTR
jgi:pimeloyl-ACP methyl ester carboxylesterase